LTKRKVRKLPEKPKNEKTPSSEPGGTKHAIKKRVVLFSMLLITLSGFLVYANSINGKFLWDDEILIQENKEIRSWDNVSRIFTENIGTGVGRNYNFYRPLHMFTLMVNYSLCKLDVRGYHLTNIILHILTALCIYPLTNLLFKNNIFRFKSNSFIFILYNINSFRL